MCYTLAPNWHFYSTILDSYLCRQTLYTYFLYLFICLYICVYIYFYVHIYKKIYIYIYIYMNMYIYNKYIYIYITYIYVCIYIIINLSINPLLFLFTFIFLLNSSFGGRFWVIVLQTFEMIFINFNRFFNLYLVNVLIYSKCRHFIFIAFMLLLIVFFCVCVFEVI